jgi:hypothetical protein
MRDAGRSVELLRPASRTRYDNLRVVACALNLPDAELIANGGPAVPRRKRTRVRYKAAPSRHGVTSSLNLALGLIGFVCQVLQEFKEIWRLANEEPIFR